MGDKFHQRFNIEVGLEKAKENFVNRVYNLVFTEYLFSMPERPRGEISRWVLTALGLQYDYATPFSARIGRDFLRNLEALEAVYEGALCHWVPQPLDEQIKVILSISEVDLGVRWENGKFLRSGVISS